MEKKLAPVIAILFCLSCLVLLSSCGQEKNFDYDTTFPSGTAEGIRLEFSTATPSVTSDATGRGPATGTGSSGNESASAQSFNTPAPSCSTAAQTAVQTAAPAQPVSTAAQATVQTVAPTPVPSVYIANEVQITKSPTSETVSEGGSALFISGAVNSTSVNWILVSPDAKTSLRIQDIASYFSEVTVEGQGTERLRLSNIPSSMNGWRVQCYFTGEGGPKYTSGAYITVLTTTPSPSVTFYPWVTASPGVDLENATAAMAVANAKTVYATAAACGYTASDISNYSYYNGTATYSMTFTCGVKSITAQFTTGYYTGSGPGTVYYYVNGQAYTEDLTGQSLDTFYSRLTYFKSY